MKIAQLVRDATSALLEKQISVITYVTFSYQKNQPNLKTYFFKKVVSFYYCYYFKYFIFKRFYLFNFREGWEGGRKKGRETSVCGCLSCTLYWGPVHNPGMCLRLGIKPVTLRLPAFNPLSHTNQGYCFKYFIVLLQFS